MKYIATRFSAKLPSTTGVSLARSRVASTSVLILVRARALKRMLLREERTLVQRVSLALGFSVIFGLGVATRVVTQVYRAADLGVEGSLLAGILGGYVTGLVSGILISIPAMCSWMSCRTFWPFISGRNALF